MANIKHTYDIVIFGASSFVGKIVVTHLFQNHNASLRWAIAGRNQQKLQQLKSSLGNQSPTPDILIADANDEMSLLALCAQTNVLVSTVGPYALYGDLVVKACAATGTHYCDLCGEVQWIRKMIIEYQAQTYTTGAYIVNSCGFDSIPSDIGVYFLQRQAQQRFGEHCHEIKMRCKAIKGHLSGGTVASMLNIVREVSSNPTLRKIIVNPYSLCINQQVFQTRQDIIKGAFFDKDFSSWCSPFIMAGINTRIVHRSNALMSAAYGKDFKYSEASLTGAGFKGWLKAHIRSTAMLCFFMLIAIKPLRVLLEKYILPKPGEGPNSAAQEAGFFDLRFIGYTPSGKTLRIKVSADNDPGYGSTAKMLAQAALSLAFDDYTNKHGGLWTPTSFFNDNFVQRLQEHAGLKFEVLDESP